jgi:hypothetical protein
VSRGDALLVAGHLLAVPQLLRLRTLVDEGDALLFFGVLEVGQVLIAAGWALKGRRVRALVNAGAAVAYPTLWLMRRGGTAAKAA